ncbi:unnamed protein product [Diplocarpon coronariae]
MRGALLTLVTLLLAGSACARVIPGRLASDTAVALEARTNFRHAEASEFTRRIDDRTE